MGIAQSTQSNKSNHSFFQFYSDSNFGQTQVFRNNHNPNQFALLIQQYIPQQQLSIVLKNIQSFKAEHIQSQNQLPFLKIINFSISQLSNYNFLPSCQIPQINILVQFLRHDLKSFIKWRKTQKIPLSLDQITMALNKAIYAYQLTKNNQILGISLNLQDISVTINGQIKFNPLISKYLAKQLIKKNKSTALRSCNTSPLKQKTQLKREYKLQKQNINPKLNIRQKIQQKYCVQSISKDKQFLIKLKKFANQLIWDSVPQNNNLINPEEYYYQIKKMKRFLSQLHNIRTIKQFKKFIGESHIQQFYVDLAKIKYEQSQSKFSKMLSQIEQKSQKTDYTRNQSFHFSPKNQSVNKNQSFQYQSPNKKYSVKNHRLFTPEYYQYS